jgi:hypothetical protein
MAEIRRYGEVKPIYVALRRLTAKTAFTGVKVTTRKPDQVVEVTTPPATSGKNCLPQIRSNRTISKAEVTTAKTVRMLFHRNQRCSKSSLAWRIDESFVQFRQACVTR